MKTRRAATRRSAARWAVPTVLTALGLLTGALSWWIQTLEPWWSSALINVSVVLLLLVPGEIVLRWLRRSVERLAVQADSALNAAAAAQESANRTERSLADVREALLARQTDEHEAELDIYRRIVSEPTRESLFTALLHATELEIVTASGVRAPVWETELHYRFVIDGERETLTVQLEQDDGTVVSTHPWVPGTSAIEFFQSLVQAVREAGADLGLHLNDPTNSVQELSEMLVDVGQLRAQELMGHRNTLRKIIERIDGWYFTERYVLPAEDLKYTIAVDRLDEMDWEEHLRKKGWYRAVTMIPFARLLYRLGATPAEE